ncbi:SWF or SNF family helicase [Streptomyces sp. NPDC058373]|uniref:SWIM zinc finger family protein n=1 Tax=unclassified Streptomyces TaxID=2593676 RepID=UPI00364B3C6D
MTAESGMWDGDEAEEFGGEDASGTAPAQERTFAALPPAGGRGFATSWWGQSWLRALEETALDSAQLKAGRRLARAGAVGAVSVRPGRITAVVQDRAGAVYRADVVWEPLSPDGWDRFVDMALERAAHVAALLDREMPPHLVEDAAQAGVDLLPGIGDLEPSCTCEAWDHCGHTAALSYQMARLLDQDPFVLLLMRGRAERALLDSLQVRGTRRAARRAGPGRAAPAEGVPAGEAYALGALLPPLPPLPEPPEYAGETPNLGTEAAPAPGVDAGALTFLAGQAAEEARRLLARAVAPGHAETPVEAALPLGADAVRLAAARPGAEAAQRLADASGRSREGLALAVWAWEFGGATALRVLEEDQPLTTETAARARAALDAAWEEGERPAFRAARGRWTLPDEGVQVRSAPDGRWWPYRKERGRWAPVGPPVRDPAQALALARASR